MKKIKLILALSALSVVLLSSTNSTFPNKPPKGKTGAPGDGTCSDCHTGAGLNMGPGNVVLSFSGSGNKYTPGKSYTITVTVTDPTELRFAFESLSLDQNNNQAGKPKITDVNYTTIQTDNASGKKYVSSYTAFEKNVWTYKWTAPTTNIGNVTFYACGNATNWDNTSAGDNVYSTSLTIAASTSPQQKEENLFNELSFSSYPSPITQNNFTSDFSLDQPSDVSIQLIGINGQMIEMLFNAPQDAGHHQQPLHVSKTITPGIYLLAFNANQHTLVRKVVFQ